MAAPIAIQGSALIPGTAVSLFSTTWSLSGTAGNVRPQYDVAADGRFLMNITTEEATSPVTIILNWIPK
jgi:hypothetical protein